MPTKPKRPILTTSKKGEKSRVYPFTEEEYRKGIATLKNNRAVGIDYLGPREHRWLHSMLNTCFTKNKIPKVWRQPESLSYLSQGKTLRFQRDIDQALSYVIPIHCTNNSF